MRNQSDPKWWIPTGKTVVAAGAAWELKPERVTEAVPGVGTGAARQSRSHRKLYLNSIYAPETCPKVPAACVSPSVCLGPWCAMFAQRQCGYIASCMPGLDDWSSISWRATIGTRRGGGRRVAHIKSTCQIKLLCWKQLNFAPCFISGCRLLLGHVIPCLDGLPGGLASSMCVVCIFCGQMAEIYVYIANMWICVRDITKLNSFCLLGLFKRRLVKLQ